jgi:hypothetical protein
MWSYICPPQKKCCSLLLYWATMIILLEIRDNFHLIFQHALTGTAVKFVMWAPWFSYTNRVSFLLNLVRVFKNGYHVQLLLFFSEHQRTKMDKDETWCMLTIGPNWGLKTRRFHNIGRVNILKQLNNVYVKIREEMDEICFLTIKHFCIFFAYKTTEYNSLYSLNIWEDFRNL